MFFGVIFYGHLLFGDVLNVIVLFLCVLQTSYGSCNVSALDNMFRTPLHWAAALGKFTGNLIYLYGMPKLFCGGPPLTPLQKTAWAFYLTVMSLYASLDHTFG